MCHYYDKSNVPIMMSLVQLDTNQEGEEYEYTVPSKYCVILCVFTRSEEHTSELQSPC